MILIDGKKVASAICKELRSLVSTLQGRKPCLAVISVGDHAPSQIYIKRKMKACEDVGILSVMRKLPSAASFDQLLAEIALFNKDGAVDGILVQLPLPFHINPLQVTLAIDANKDVDGFHPLNVGKMFIGSTDTFFPCTPLGIKTLLARYQLEVTGKHVVVIGRSNIVGKPMAAILLQSSPGGNATVTVAHRHTPNIGDLCRSADILIVAVGQPHFVTADMVKEGVVVIDVGINKVVSSASSTGYQIVGDVEFDQVKEKCSYITPVPGGVGPMTIAMLLSNTIYSYSRREKLELQLP